MRLIGDLVIVGSSITDFPLVKEMPPGDVRGFDAATGKLKWSFQIVPRDGESGAETWEGDSHKHTGSANVWSIMSADEKVISVEFVEFSDGVSEIVI